jgi:hypothetical protein
MKCDELKKVFPDWETIEPGEWSKHGITISQGMVNGKERFAYIGLYREPAKNEEYAGTYTLQIMNGDDVIFCCQV